MKRRDAMRSPGRFALLAVVAALFALLVASADCFAETAMAPASAPGLPRIVDVGTESCFFCKRMAPMLQELKKEYEGVLVVEVVDVWKNPQAGRDYRIRMLPTQIFYDAEGKELKRHSGYMSKKGILEEFRKLGIPLKPRTARGSQG